MSYVLSVIDMSRLIGNMILYSSMKWLWLCVCVILLMYVVVIGNLLLSLSFCRICSSMNILKVGVKLYVIFVMLIMVEFYVIVFMWLCFFVSVGNRNVLISWLIVLDVISMLICVGDSFYL